MDKFIRFGAYLSNVALLLAVFFLLTNIRGSRDMLMVILLAVPPTLCLLALGVVGIDLEERRLTRQVAKLRLQREIEELSAEAPKKKK